MTLRTDEPSETELLRIEAVAYINSAPNKSERDRRNREMYIALFAGATLFDYLKAEAERRADPLDTGSNA